MNLCRWPFQDLRLTGHTCWLKAKERMFRDDISFASPRCNQKPHKTITFTPVKWEIKKHRGQTIFMDERSDRNVDLGSESSQRLSLSCHNHFDCLICRRINFIQPEFHKRHRIVVSPKVQWAFWDVVNAQQRSAEGWFFVVLPYHTFFLSYHTIEEGIYTSYS